MPPTPVGQVIECGLCPPRIVDKLARISRKDFSCQRWANPATGSFEQLEIKGLFEFLEARTDCSHHNIVLACSSGQAPALNGRYEDAQIHKVEFHMFIFHE
jgi:hypothetical protein